MYILNILRNNLLESCEIFDDAAVAFRSAEYFCDYNNLEKNIMPASSFGTIPSLYETFATHQYKLDPYFNGWVICSEHGYHVSIVQRAINITTHIPKTNYAVYDMYSNYRNPLTALMDYGQKFLTPKPIITPPELVLKPAPVTEAPVPYEYAAGDDPLEISLPGGFDLDGRPIDVDYISLSPYEIKDYNLLSENERWALFQARTNHRRNQVILLPNVGCFSQTYILQHIKSRSNIGKMMLIQEMAILAKHLEEIKEIRDNEESSDEESSSSSEEEDLD